MSYYTSLAGLNWLCRIDWPQTQRLFCIFISDGIKGLYEPSSLSETSYAIKPEISTEYLTLQIFWYY